MSRYFFSNVCRFWERLRERLQIFIAKNILPGCYFELSLRQKIKRNRELPNQKEATRLSSTTRQEILITTNNLNNYGKSNQ